MASYNQKMIQYFSHENVQDSELHITLNRNINEYSRKECHSSCRMVLVML